MRANWGSRVLRGASNAREAWNAGFVVYGYLGTLGWECSSTGTVGSAEVPVFSRAGSRKCKRAECQVDASWVCATAWTVHGLDCSGAVVCRVGSLATEAIGPPAGQRFFRLHVRKSRISTVCASARCRRRSWAGRSGSRLVPIAKGRVTALARRGIECRDAAV